jgi:UDP-glucose 4-epimerase
MRVFVTGGAGYIGSVCVEELLNNGHEVCVFDNLSEGHKEAVDKRAKLLLGDLLRFQEIHDAVASFRPDAVIHFAGKALVGESMEKPFLYYETNVGGGNNLLEAMRLANCKRIVFSSTCATYGVPDRIPISEDTPQQPINPYGHSKLMFEQILRWYENRHGIQYTALRYFNAAGASEQFGEHHRIETHLIPNILKAAMGKGPKVSIYGVEYPTPDGTCIRDFIHLKDLASAHILAMKWNGSGCFNLGTGRGHSVREVIDSARRITGIDIQANVMPPRSGDPPRLVADASLTRRTLNWEPAFTEIDPIVESAWRWSQAHPDGYQD